MKRSHLLLAVVSIVLIAYLLSFADIGAVARALSFAQLPLVALALCFALLSLSLRTLRWKVLLDQRSILPFWTVLSIQAAGTALSNLSPGKLLEPVKVLPLKRHGIEYGFAILSVFWERVFDLFVLVGFSFAAFAVFNQTLQYAIGVGIMVLALLALLMFRSYRRVFQLFARLPFLSFLSRLDGHDFKKEALAKSFLLTAAAWLSDGAAAFCVFTSLSLHIGYLPLASALFASTLAGVLSFLPGGIGSTEAIMVLILRPYAFPLASVVAAVLLTRVILFGTGMVAGLLSLPKVQAEAEGKTPVYSKSH